MGTRDVNPRRCEADCSDFSLRVCLGACWPLCSKIENRRRTEHLEHGVPAPPVTLVKSSIDLT